MEDIYTISELGWEMAQDIWDRFSATSETLEEIAESYDIDVDTLRVFMHMVFAGGVVAIESE